MIRASLFSKFVSFFVLTVTSNRDSFPLSYISGLYLTSPKKRCATKKREFYGLAWKSLFILPDLGKKSYRPLFQTETTQTSDSGSPKSYSTVLRLTFKAKPHGCENPWIHKRTLPVIPEQNTELGHENCGKSRVWRIFNGVILGELLPCTI